MGVIQNQSLRLIAVTGAAVIGLAGCSSGDDGVATRTDGPNAASSTSVSPMFIAGGDWSVPGKVGIGGYAVVTDADAFEILNDKDASVAYTYFVNDQAFLQFSKAGTPTAAEMLNFRFNEELLNFYQAQADEQRPSSSPEVQELNPVGVALYRKVVPYSQAVDGTTVLVRKITGPNVGEDSEMCANSSNGNQNGLGVCRVVRDGNIYLFEVRGMLDEAEGKMWVTEFLADVGLTGLTA